MSKQDFLNPNFQEILEVLRARGSLEKSDILSTWALTEDDYAALRKAFSKISDVEPGPRKIGGFRIKAKRGHLPTSEEHRANPVPGEGWEQAAITRLCELLQHQDLEKLLGDLVYTVRLSRKLQTGEDRRGTKEELAHALLLKHGVDLFRDDEVRNAVAKRCKAGSPGRWHPGKATAHRFVKDAGFPPDLAGIPSEDPPEDFGSSVKTVGEFWLG